MFDPEDIKIEIDRKKRKANFLAYEIMNMIRDLTEEGMPDSEILEELSTCLLLVLYLNRP